MKPAAAEWSPRAAADRTSQLAYIRARNPAAAMSMNRAILRTISSLQQNPELGRIGAVTGTREFAVPGTPYIIVYRVAPGMVTIIRLLHHAQNWP